MKTGNVWPYVRARWMITNEAQFHFQPPVWAKIFELSVIILLFYDDIPVPVFITDTDCSLGQWRYDPVLGRIVWKGTWAVIGYDGTWQCTQTLRADEFVDIVVSLLIVSDETTRECRFEFPILQSHGLWSNSSDYLIDLRSNTVCTYPWLIGDHVIMKPATYAEIRSAGIDPDNTEPVTWTYES